MQNELILQGFENTQKAILLLEFSIKRFKPYKIRKIYTPKELEYYDALSFRFEKGIELLLALFKALEDIAYGKISDTLRDRLLIMVKLNIIDSVDFWMESRKIRNRIAHTYITDELKDLYNEIFKRSKKFLRQWIILRCF